jgi:hypothetical protein
MPPLSKPFASCGLRLLACARRLFLPILVLFAAGASLRTCYVYDRNSWAHITCHQSHDMRIG